MPEISVIVPVYNVENKIRRCIDSILAQTFTDFELILVDDGSPDQSGVICDEYILKDSRISVYHKENGGVASAKNYGLDKAQGKYITFVDSDDYIDEDALQLLFCTADNSDLRIAGLRYLDEITLTPHTELCLTEQCIKRGDFANCVSALLDSRALNYHVAKLYRRIIIEEHSIRFTDFRVSGGDDTIFNFDFLKFANSVSVINKNIYNYILYSSSTSHRYTGDKWKRSKVLDSYLRNAVVEMHIDNKKTQTSLNKRIVFAALWSAEELIYVNTLSFIQKRQQFSSISKDKVFTNAIHSLDNLRENKSLYYLSKNRWLAFYCIEVELMDRMKGFISRLIPIEIKEKYHRRKGSA